MIDQNADMESTPNVDRSEVEAIGEVLASLEIGDGGNVSENAATETTPSPAAHTLPIAAETSPVPGRNEANSSSNLIIPEVDQQDWVSGNSDELFDVSHGLFPPNMPTGSPTGELIAWPSDNQLAQSLIDFAKEEASFDKERTSLMLDLARRRLFIRRSNAIEQRERERPNTEDFHGMDAHFLIERERLQLHHVDYIRLYGDPLPPNTDEEKQCLTAEAAIEEAQAWYNKVKQWKVPAVDSDIFRFFWSAHFMQLLRDRGRDELLRGLRGEMWITQQIAREFGREVARGDIPQADGSSSPPPTSQSTTQNEPGPASSRFSSSDLNPNAAPFQPRPQTLTEAHQDAPSPTGQPATARENANPSSDETGTPTPPHPFDHPTPRAPHQQQQRQSPPSPTLTGHPNFYGQMPTTNNPLQDSLLTSSLTNPTLHMQHGRNTYHLDTSTPTAPLTHSRQSTNIRVQGHASALLPDETLRHTASTSSLAGSRTARDARAREVELGARDYEAAREHRAEPTQPEEEDEQAQAGAAPHDDRQTTSSRGGTLRLSAQNRTLRGELFAAARRNAAITGARARGVRLVPLGPEPMRTLAQAVHAAESSRRVRAEQSESDDGSGQPSQLGQGDDDGDGETRQSGSGLRGGASGPDELALMLEKFRVRGEGEEAK
ncbi:hypothetical protein LTR70_006653 [Exophiala xenobiotica]|nr:hypothetical protein LTR70_006653 [Exophiala xenobiotica]